MSSKRSSRGSLKLDAAVCSTIEEIQKAIEFKEESLCRSTIETCSATILNLLSSKSTERKCFIRRSSNGVETLTACLKRPCTQQTVLNILAVFTCLCERKYRNKLLNQGVLDSLLESLGCMSKDDTVLLPYHRLLLKLASKDKKFPLKARMTGLLPVTAAFLKRSVNDSSTLSVVLTIIRILASNATNVMALGRHGCIGVFPKLLSVYGSYDYRMLEIILKSYRPLLSKKSNSSKRAVATSIPSLIAIYDKLHHTDTTGKHIGIRKLVITVLSRVIVSDACKQAFHKANGLVILSSSAKELHEDTRVQFRSLSSLVCNVLRKALPLTHLPINVLDSPIPYSLETSPLKSPPILFNVCSEVELTEISENKSNASFEKGRASSSIDLSVSGCGMQLCKRNKSESALGETTKRLDLLQVMPSPGLEEEPPATPSSRPSLSYFVDLSEAVKPNSSRHVDLSSFNKLFPEIDVLENPNSVKISKLPHKSTSLTTLPSSLAARNIISIPRAPRSTPNFRKCLTEQPTPTTSPPVQPTSSQPSNKRCIITVSPESDLPVVMVINEYLKTLSRGELKFNSTHPTEPCTLYKRTNHIEREIVFQDVSRHISPDDLINRVVYDIEDQLVFPSSCSSPSSDVVRSSSDYQPTSTTTGSDDDILFSSASCSGPPGDSSSRPLKVALPHVYLYPDALVFSSVRESCNLRKAIQIRSNEYDLLLNSDINTDHHHQWFLFEVSNTIAGCKYRFNIINCEKSDSQFNYGMQPVLYSTTTGTWSRVGTDIMYYRNNFTYRQPASDSSTSGEGSTGNSNGRKKSAGKYRLKSGGASRNGGGGGLVKRFYTLTFSVVFPIDKDVCFLAYHYPYTVSMLKHDLSITEDYLRLATPDNFYYHRQELCPTLSGNSCPLITITNLPPCEPPLSPPSLEHKNKDYIVLSSRVHPGESNASWVMKGAIEFLTSRDPKAEWLRDRFIFKLIPMLNPDGVANGRLYTEVKVTMGFITSSDEVVRLINAIETIPKYLTGFYHDYCWDPGGIISRFINLLFCNLIGQFMLVMVECTHRCSLSGHDLNRQWISPDPLLHPTIFHTKGLIQWLTEHNRKPFLFCDFHGHSRKKNVFLFGCRNSSTVKELPVFLSQTTPLFSLANCTYNVEKSKEATGRVVVWRMGVERSYTMESTYCGRDTPSGEGLQIQIQDLLEMGRDFCIGLYKLAHSDYPSMLDEGVDDGHDDNYATPGQMESFRDNEICIDSNEEDKSNEDDEYNSTESDEDSSGAD